MEKTNPYAPPEVERTVYRSPHEILFEYQRSSRNVGSFVLSVVVGLLAISILMQVVSELFNARSNGIVLGADDLFFGFLGLAFWLALSAWLITGIVSPRFVQFRVDREFVSWRAPWPRASEGRILVTSVVRVEYEGTQVTIATDDKNWHRPPPRTYGNQTEEVLEAIKAAVNESEPRTRVSESHRTTSISLMRWLGRAVGYFLRAIGTIRRQ